MTFDSPRATHMLSAPSFQSKSLTCKTPARCISNAGPPNRNYPYQSFSTSPAAADSGEETTMDSHTWRFYHMENDCEETPITQGSAVALACRKRARRNGMCLAGIPMRRGHLSHGLLDRSRKSSGKGRRGYLIAEHRRNRVIRCQKATSNSDITRNSG